VGAEILVAARQVFLGLAVEIAEGGRQAVAAMFARRQAKRPQRVL
jgi:hypothetical protein